MSPTIQDLQRYQHAMQMFNEYISECLTMERSIGTANDFGRWLERKSEKLIKEARESLNE